MKSKSKRVISNNTSSERKDVVLFWEWFMLNASTLSALLRTGEVDEIANIVGPKMQALHAGLGWEIGPGTVEPYAFTISLNGSLSNLLAARTIVEAALKPALWEINIGKPPKSWNGRFELRNKDGQVVLLDASEWRYTLTGFQNNSFFDITIIARWPRMDFKAKLQAVWIAVQSSLGEVEALTKIGRVSIEKLPNAEAVERCSQFLSLKKHLNEIGLKRHNDVHQDDNTSKGSVFDA